MIDWYDALPESWEKTRLGWTANVYTGYTFDSDNFNNEEGPKVVRIRDVPKGDTDTHYNGELPDGYWIYSGDVLVGMDGDFHVGTWNGGRALLNQRVACIAPDTEVESKFFRYAVEKPLSIIQDLTRSTTVKHLSIDDLRNISIPRPPLEKMELIVDFLDDNLGYINGLIEEKRHLREVLNEKIKAIIKESTTGGLSPESNYKNSEIDWIGDIPEHWDVVRTRFVAQLESGHTPSKSNDDYWVDCDIPWVTTSDIKPFRSGRKIYLEDTEHKINELGLENSGARMLPEGTVFLSRTASVGFSGIMGREMATSQDFANWIPSDEVLSEYLVYVFRSMDQEFDRLTQGSTHQTIYMPDIRSFKMPLPPKEEQQEIVEHIQQETEKIWKLIDKVNEAVDLLKEKRQALITAAVTGQIDVTEDQSDDQEVLQ
jgi:restriction endonuclease S subunit